MPVTCVFGSQWGDEGKGKVVDFLSEQADYCVRYQGGSNAGHTIYIGDQRYALRLTPSGVLQGATGVIGNGVLVDPKVLLAEIETLEERGHEVRTRLKISDRAQLVLPFHGPLDRALDASRIDIWKVGTTGRGISTAMADKHLYEGFRAADLLSDRVRSERLRYLIDRGNRRLVALGAEPLAAEEAEAEVESWVKWMRPMVCDTSRLLLDAAHAGREIVLEGAQAALLDVDFGTYPFVSTSNCGVAGAAAGTGLPPRAVDRIIAVAKAYVTRVGKGPFPTRETGEAGKRMGEKGKEFGTVTGRPRDCGWFDAVAMRHVCRLNGVDELALTKIDVLSGLDPLRICIAYDLDGERLEHFPADVDALRRCRPIFRELPGFAGDLSAVRSRKDLPEGVLEYLRAIEELAGVPISLLSVGPERTETVLLGDS